MLDKNSFSLHSPLIFLALPIIELHLLKKFTFEFLLPFVGSPSVIRKISAPDTVVSLPPIILDVSLS